MRALSLVLLGLMLSCGDVRRCKDKTLLVDVELSGAAAGADTLLVDVSMGGSTPAHTRLDHSPGVKKGRIEIDFPSGYPGAGAVTVTVTAERGSQVLGSSLAIAFLAPQCATTAIFIGDPMGLDGGATDGPVLCPGGTCELPVPADPEFKGTDVWKLDGDAAIDPTAPGIDDVGQLILDQTAICSAGGSARQRITMPDFADSGPLALIHSVARDCATSGFGCVGGNAAVRFREGALVIPAGSPMAKGKTCLGARAFGGTYDLIVAAGDKNDCADPMLTLLDLRVDRLSIQAEPACPDPGTIQNATFDGDGDKDAGWGLQLNNGTATIDAGIGEGGSRAGHITTSRLCQSPKLRGSQSVPMGPQVALSLLVKGTAGKAALVGEEANQARWASVTGTGVFETPRICVPEYAKGMVLPLILSAETPQGSCATLDMRDFVFDNLSFVTEPSCPTTTFVIDPGFERHSVVAQWNLAVDGASGVDQAAATVVEDAAGAHGGTHALRLSTKQLCVSARANTVVTVPQPTATAGPVLKLFYRAPVLSNTTLYATANASQVRLTESATWRQASLCLDPARAGQGQYVEVTLNSAGICGKSSSEESAFFDDFEVTTDPSCPAK